MLKLTKQRYFIELSYDGTPWHGWQIQPNAASVQQCVDEALSTVFRQKVATLGCGRTDTGVHALQFYAHFDLENIEPSLALAAERSINALLPYSVAVLSIHLVDNEAHARFDATERTYNYHIHFRKDPFKQHTSWLMRDIPDLERMNKAAKNLLSFSDFSAFSKSNTQTFTNNCSIKEAKFESTENGMVFKITADRFLRNMVRAIVGTLVDIGKNERAPDALIKIIEGRDRSAAGQSVPACGLYLVKVKYPYITNR